MNLESNFKGVIIVVLGMIEEFDEIMFVEVGGVDVLVSEWMGYCLFFELMLLFVFYVCDCWLKCGGVIFLDFV